MFSKNKYQVCKNMISKELADFVFNYLRMKKQTFYSLKRIGVDARLLGTDGDPQAPGTYSCYSDIAMETLLTIIHSKLEKKTKLKLAPTYTYTRLYKNGDELKRHQDRFSCEISATLNLGGDLWPIYLEDANKKDENLLMVICVDKCFYIIITKQLKVGIKIYLITDHTLDIPIILQIINHDKNVR